MNDKKRLPIGYENFKEIIEKDLYYVDKTKVIEELLVNKSYVGFVVTETMANNNSGMVAGTYYIKGGDGGDSFVENAKIIYDAFTTRCSSNPYSTNPTSYFSCSVSSIFVYANADGTVNVYWSTGNYDYGCHVNSNGSSNCYVA